LRSSILWLALIVASVPSASAQSADAQRRLMEANSQFTYEGAPISPLAVQELLSHILDSLPGPVAIDLAGTRRGDDYSNRYFATTIKTDPDGAVTIDLRDAGSRSRGDTNPGWFSYKRIGSLRNGVHVLETWDNGGGSGIFTSLLFVKFAIDDDYSQGASDAFLRRQTIVIKRVGEFTLGDRYGGKVVVRGATVEVGADDRNRKKAVVLRMP